MEIQLLGVPYDSAMHGARMGAGPEHLLNTGLEDHLRAAGHSTTLNIIEAPAEQPLAEIRTAFELNRTLAEGVRAASAAGRLPIVLAGNCNTAVGTLAGIGCEGAGVIWFDAHADYNTPETSLSGFLDGMALAIVTGRCWPKLAASVPGFEPVPEEDVLLIGARDMDPAEVKALESCPVTLFSSAQARTELGSALEALSRRVHRVYVHVDLDILDPSEGRANALAAPGGLELGELEDALALIGKKLRIGAAAFTAYDPTLDDDGRIREAAFSLIDRVARA